MWLCAFRHLYHWGYWRTWWWNRIRIRWRRVRWHQHVSKYFGFTLNSNLFIFIFVNFWFFDFQFSWAFINFFLSLKRTRTRSSGPSPLRGAQTHVKGLYFPPLTPTTFLLFSLTFPIGFILLYFYKLFRFRFLKILHQILYKTLRFSFFSHKQQYQLKKARSATNTLLKHVYTWSNRKLNWNFCKTSMKTDEKERRTKEMREKRAEYETNWEKSFRKFWLVLSPFRCRKSRYKLKVPHVDKISLSCNL